MCRRAAPQSSRQSIRSRTDRRNPRRTRRETTAREERAFVPAGFRRAVGGAGRDRPDVRRAGEHRGGIDEVAAAVRSPVGDDNAIKRQLQQHLLPVGNFQMRLGGDGAASVRHGNVRIPQRECIRPRRRRTLHPANLVHTGGILRNRIDVILFAIRTNNVSVVVPWTDDKAVFCIVRQGFVRVADIHILADVVSVVRQVREPLWIRAVLIPVGIHFQAIAMIRVEPIAAARIVEQPVIADTEVMISADAPDVQGGNGLCFRIVGVASDDAIVLKPEALSAGIPFHAMLGGYTIPEVIAAVCVDPALQLSVLAGPEQLEPVFVRLCTRQDDGAVG